MFNRSAAKVNLHAETVTPAKTSNHEREDVCVSSAQTHFEARGGHRATATISARRACDGHEAGKRSCVQKGECPELLSLASPWAFESSLFAHLGHGAAVTQAIKCMESQHSCLHPQRHLVIH